MVISMQQNTFKFMFYIEKEGEKTHKLIYEY